MMKKVSVIMGIYNTFDEELVKKSIDSILNQSLSDLELIICDDGSIDNTYKMISEHCLNDKRVKIIRNLENKGLAFSLNCCLEIAEGKYIARMDADDVSLPERLEKQYYFLETNERYQIVGTNAYLIDDGGRWGVRKVIETPTAEDFFKGTQFVHPTVMIRSEVYKKLNGYDTSKVTLRVEDYDFFMRAYSESYLGYNIQESLFEFREDKNTYNRRTYKYRIDEALIRYRGFKNMGLLLKGLPYVLRPLVVGLVPQTILKKFRDESI